MEKDYETCTYGFSKLFARKLEEIFEICTVEGLNFLNSQCLNLER